MANERHIQHIRSRVVENGEAKLPSSGSVYYGEIAVNYAKDYETLSIRNDSNHIVTFHPDEVQIGVSGQTEINAHSKVFIDEAESTEVPVYTIEQVDSLISGVTNLIEDDIIIGTETPTNTNTELWVDTTNDGNSYDVYTREQVDAMIADLQRQINELKNSAI